MAEKTGLIHRVDTRWEYSRIADVLAVGPEVYDVKAGDVVVVPALVGQKVGSDDDRLIPESSILYAVEDAA
jgi:co-chaperonin GroES (HSP10)